ncbi:hypothetical protein SOMG_02949 [Schizosaccharomyces osmophilus]|uniref:Uncharacterized protein n=1 Tax=Schizosaccharomyces osmophilus TaxID=2545709 RepID=A0AAE9WGM0_9SCHI|nr:uncharacterized protein SOMG_02949 [Schizosaccharomyces osmophilus]WBW74363.1 hypothetical protein SOMG_02949 [Schizosaccharomyces osmophilus]
MTDSNSKEREINKDENILRGDKERESFVSDLLVLPVSRVGWERMWREHTGKEIWDKVVERSVR